jgi:hypothetical protein
MHIFVCQNEKKNLENYLVTIGTSSDHKGRE